MLAWTDTCVTRSVPGGPAPLPPGANLTGVVVLAGPDDPDPFEYDSRFECTHWPCDLLWAQATQLMPWSGSPVTTAGQTRSRLLIACS